MTDNFTTFIHLSDIHFCTNSGDLFDLDSDIRIQIEHDLDGIKTNIGEIAGILITGDIAFSGQGEEYTKALVWLSRLTKIIGCREQNVWVVPGNHDVKRTLVDQSKIIQTFHKTMRDCPVQKVDKELRSFLNDNASKGLFEPLEDYIKFASRYRCEIKPKKPFWEDEIHLNDGSLLRIRGLTSTIISDRHDDNRANKLVLGAFQTILPNSPEITNMILCHHPPDWLHDQDMVDRNLKSRARITLLGHKHSEWIEYVKAAGNASVRIYAGAIHPDRNDPGWSPRYNIISLRVVVSGVSRKLKIQVKSRVWNDDTMQFVSDTSCESSGSTTA